MTYHIIGKKTLKGDKNDSTEKDGIRGQGRQPDPRKDY